MTDSDRVLDKAAKYRAVGKPFALVTVVRSESHTSAIPVAKAVVDAEGNIHGWIGGCTQPAVIKRNSCTHLFVARCSLPRLST